MSAMKIKTLHSPLTLSPQDRRHLPREAIYQRFLSDSPLLDPSFLQSPTLLPNPAA
jgi:hypothetical protein